MNFLPRALPCAASLLLFLLLPGFAAASPDSRPRVPAEPLPARCLAHADFNGDGTPDLLMLDSSGIYLLLAQDDLLLRSPARLCQCLQRHARVTISATAGLDPSGLPGLVFYNASVEEIAQFRNLGRKPGDAGKPGDWLGFAEAPKAR